MKYLYLALVILGSCAQVGGGGGAGTPDANPLLTDAPYIGHWLSDCTDLGGGTVNRVYLEIEKEGKINLAILAYASPNCTGAHVLKDNSGNDITEAVYTQNVSQETVTAIPENMYVLKLTDINSSNVQYVVMYVNDVEFYELTGFTNAHTTWTQWQGEADVFAFSENPSTYSPTTSDKFHFVKSELP